MSLRISDLSSDRDATKVSREPLHSWYKGLYPENVLYAINCGADEPHTDMNGVEWQPDTGAIGGVKSEAGGN
jgi:hypothetical protein